MPVTVGRQPLEADPMKVELQARSADRRSRQRRASLVQDLPPTTSHRNDLRPELKMRNIALDEIKLPARQVRKVGPDDIAEVAQSIERFGQSAPIIVGRDNKLIDGAVVVAAAKELGLRTLACVHVNHLTPEEESALRIVLGRMGHKRETDIEALHDELARLEKHGLQIRGLGYTDQELDQIMLRPLTDAKPQVDVDEAAELQSICQAGDRWLLGDHVLLCGDAKEQGDWQLLMDGEAAQLVLTDPPYGVAVNKVVSTKHRDFVEGGGDMTHSEFEAMIVASFDQAHCALVPGGMLFSYMNWVHVDDLIRIGKQLGYEHINLVTWVKNQGGMGSFYRSQSEFVIVLKKTGKHKNNVQLGKHGRDRTNVWHYAGAGTSGTAARSVLKDHPTPKPVDMLVDAILDVTDREDIVVDPFGGSGSTLMACEETGRKARLIEKDPLYCDTIIRRWMTLTGKMPLLSGTEYSYADVADQRAIVEETPHARG
jgi:DNA modification methylase